MVVYTLRKSRNPPNVRPIIQPPVFPVLKWPESHSNVCCIFFPRYLQSTENQTTKIHHQVDQSLKYPITSTSGMHLTFQNSNGRRNHTLLPKHGLWVWVKVWLLVHWQVGFVAPSFRVRVYCGCHVLYLQCKQEWAEGPTHHGTC